jgi:hypothetical protein
MAPNIFNTFVRRVRLLGDSPLYITPRRRNLYISLRNHHVHISRVWTFSPNNLTYREKRQKKLGLLPN